VPPQLGRIQEDISHNLSGTWQYPINDILTAQQKGAGPAYEKVFSIKHGVMTDELKSLMIRPSFQPSLKNAIKHAQETGVDPKGLGIDLNAAGEPVFVKTPTMETWDWIKRGMDRQINSHKDTLTGKLSDEGRDIARTKDALLTELDRLYPEYKVARDIFSGPASMKEAFRDGASALSDDAAMTARDIAKMPAGERAMFQAGVAKAIRDKAAATPDSADAVKRIFGNELIRERIRASFPKADDYANFEFNLRREASMFTSQTRTSPNVGSQTEPRAAEKSALNSAGDQAMDDLLIWGRGPHYTALRAVGHLLTGGKNKVDPAEATAISRTLFDPDATRQMERLRGLMSRRVGAAAPTQRGMLDPFMIGPGASGIGLLGGR
jgi:hypothetical protein